jgi:hypothetical protein
MSSFERVWPRPILGSWVRRVDRSDRDRSGIGGPGSGRFNWTVEFFFSKKLRGSNNFKKISKKF